MRLLKLIVGFSTFNLFFSFHTLTVFKCFTIKSRLLIKNKCNILNVVKEENINSEVVPTISDSVNNDAKVNVETFSNNSNANNQNESTIDWGNGIILLNFVAIIWGSQHVVIKSSLSDYTLPSLLNFWRFTLSAMLFSPSLLNILNVNRYHFS